MNVWKLNSLYGRKG